MKKPFCSVIGVVLICAAMSACSVIDFNYNPPGSVVGTPADGTETNDGSSRSVESDETDEGDDVYIQTAAHIEVFEEGDSVIEYVVVTGLPDFELQTALNDELKNFFTWPLFDSENPDKTITSTARFTIIGNKYISVRTYETEYTDGAAYPINNAAAMVFSLDTGEFAGHLIDFINIDPDSRDITLLREAFDAGIFELVYPEEEFDGAADIVLEHIADSPHSAVFYLTETALGLGVTGLPHAIGGYVLFEADYDDIEELLTERLLSALDGGLTYGN